MSNDLTRIVEIGGIKMEVDLRDCKVIEHYKIGDQIKVLMKKYDSYIACPGVIIGFDDFTVLPSLVIAYLEQSYSTAEVKFFTFNAESKDIEICPLNKLDRYFSKADATARLQCEIDKKQQEIRELEQKKAYFLSAFHKYFEEPVI